MSIFWRGAGLLTIAATVAVVVSPVANAYDRHFEREGTQVWITAVDRSVA